LHITVGYRSSPASKIRFISIVSKGVWVRVTVRQIIGKLGVDVNMKEGFETIFELIID
jgi:hypothetical protein